MTLKAWLKEQGITQAQFAARIQISQGGLNDILNARKKPSLEVAARIERATEGAITAISFVEPAGEADAAAEAAA